MAWFGRRDRNQHAVGDATGDQYIEGVAYGLSAVYLGHFPEEDMSRGSVGRVFVAVIVSYLGFGLMVAVTEWLLSSATTSSRAKSPWYFVFDLTSQCLYLIAAGYVCAVIAHSNRLAVAVLALLGLSVGTFSLVTSWGSEPHWYGIALLVTYAPCLWVGWTLRQGAIDHN